MNLAEAVRGRPFRLRALRVKFARLAVLTLLLASAVPRAEAQDVLPQVPPELPLSVAVGPTLPLGRLAQRWGERIAELSHGTIATRLHAGAARVGGDGARELPGLADGTVALAVGSSLAWSAQANVLAVYSLPWLAPREAELEALVQGPALRSRVAEALAAAGVVLVDLAPLGHGVLASRRPIRAPEDVQGLSVRIASQPMLADLFTGLGARPASLPYAQAVEAFGRGGLDAQEGSASALVAMRIQGLGLTHVVEWGAVADVAVFAVNRPVWDRFSAEQRQWLQEAARSAVAEVRPLQQEAAALADLARARITRSRVTSAGHAAFQRAAAPVIDRWRVALGADLVRAAEEAVTAGSGPAK